MNKFTKKTDPSKDGTGDRRAETPWRAWLIVKMVLIMSIIFAAFFARVHLNDKTEQLAREKERITAQIEEKRTEIKKINIQIAQLKSWENINAKIRQYNLALRAANPSQVHQISRSGIDTPIMSRSDDTRIADLSANTVQNSGEIR